MRISDWSSDVCSSDLSSPRLRLELPPVRLDAETIEGCEHPGHRVVAEAAVLAVDDLDHQLAAEPTAGLVEQQELPLLPALQRVIVVGMIEHQALHRVGERPFDQRRAEVAAFEGQ